MNLGAMQGVISKLRNAVARASQPRTIGLTIDGGGATITTGPKGGFLPVPFSGRIDGWCLVADQTGSIVVDVWKAPWASFPPDAGDSICGGAKPTLASQQKAESYGTLAGWAGEVVAGDVIGFNVDSASAIQRAVLTLRVQVQLA